MKVSSLWALMVGILVAIFFAGCGGGSGGGSGNTAELAAIDAMFPTPETGPLNIAYECARANSGLTYYLLLNPDNTLLWQFEVDTGDTYRFAGTYSYGDGAIALQITDPGFPLDEVSTGMTKHLGLVYTFTTAQMACGAIGHGYDGPISVSVAHYKCPYVSQGAGSDVENAIELGGLNVGGLIFRQRDIWPAGSASAIITRGYGVYRRVGNDIYAYFGDSFDDYNVLTGTLSNNEGTLRVNELGSEQGTCSL